MKKNYQTPEFVLCYVENVDVVTTSPNASTFSDGGVDCSFDIFG